MISLLQAASPGLIWPMHLFGWIGWFAMAALLVWFCWIMREKLDPLRERWWLVIVLLVAAPFLVALPGVRLPVDMQPLPGAPIEVPPPALMFLAAVPWVLAGGLLGPVPAAVLGVLAGLMLGVFETHSPFTMLEMGALALLFSSAVRQNYRTRFYVLLRHPVVAAIFVIAVYIPLIIISALFATNGSAAVRLDYAFTQVWWVLAARAGELLIASLIAEILYLTAPKQWGSNRSLVPSPAESSIQTRFFYGTVPLVAVLILTLIVGDWLVAGRTARNMLEERLSDTAQIAAESIPYFLETGQNLILTFSEPELLDLPPGELSDALAMRLRSVPYFYQLYLFDKSASMTGGFPQENAGQVNLTDEERGGIQLALKGFSTQVYIIQPSSDESSVQVTFIAAVRDKQQQVGGVLLGRTDLNTNPFIQPVIQALSRMDGLEIEGEGMILDENGRIIYHPVASQLMSVYQGAQPTTAQFYDETSPTNTREYVYYYPVTGRPWAVVLRVPAEQAQQMALQIAIPLLFMLAVFAIVAFIFLRISLVTFTSSIKMLAQEASFISQGRLDRALKVNRVDEVGQLSQVFEQMRQSLKARLDELNSLLRVSQGVAANLDIGDAIRPILDAALLDEACAARLVLVRDVTLDTLEHGPVAFGVGPASQLYAVFDQQLFDIARQQDMLSLPNVSRMRRLQFAPGAPHPGAVMAMAVRQESIYYGVLWVAYDRPRNFSEEETRFLTTLSSETALAATSARLYATAEVGRQRLEAVLASTPEPVLVTDEQSRLLLLNPAAVQVPGLVLNPLEGRPIREVVGPEDLASLLTAPMSERISSREINLSSDKIFYATVSSVMAEGRPVGRVCILRDITHFKELDQMKSDFVNTVSHDLRSPLTLMRGYATMLQMVGDLNDQQKGYVKKIVAGVENMSRLVNNLLDLGRIETGIGLQIEKVTVSEISDEVINSLQLQAVQKDIRLTQELMGSGKNLVIEADRALIQQALYNLVENAIKYTGVGGLVKVRVNSRPDSVVLEIHDSGIGIAPLDLPHLFEKFYRSGRREAYQQRGTGLGLAIVKSIAERHGGRVWVDSQLGKGSVFSLEVPCEQPQKTNGENRKNP
jgi:PAS domain S-box-containing protein